MEESDEMDLGPFPDAHNHVPKRSAEIGNTYKSRLMNAVHSLESDLKEESKIVDEGDVSDDDMFEEEHDGLCIRLTKEDKKQIKEPWKNTLIVKLLGRPISYTYLCNRVKQLWSLKGSFEAVDMVMDNG
ncbi:hypothetical protein REPUB_Repub18cG0057400 [Reevesia pubescens]